MQRNAPLRPRLVFVAVVLGLAGTAHAVTFDEVEIQRFEMCVRRQQGQPPAGTVSIVTVDNTGDERTIQLPVMSVLSASEKTTMRNFLETVLDRVYAQRAIPTPTPSPTPSPTPTKTPIPTATPTPVPTLTPSPTHGPLATP